MDLNETLIDSRSAAHGCAGIFGARNALKMRAFGNRVFEGNA